MKKYLIEEVLSQKRLNKFDQYSKQQDHGSRAQVNNQEYCISSTSLWGAKSRKRVLLGAREHSLKNRSKQTCTIKN